MGRAIVRDPQVFLFDEPLSNLDAKLRVAMRAEIKELHQRLKTTTVYVTHDQIEAMTMADKIVVMHDGIVEQIGRPLDLYDRPDNLFVAELHRLAGDELAARRDRRRRRAVLPGRRRHFACRCTAAAGAAKGTPVVLGIRPEHLTLSDQGFPVEIVVVEPTGSEIQIIGRTPGGEEIVANFRERHEFEPGADRAARRRARPDPSLQRRNRTAAQKLNRTDCAIERGNPRRK